MRPGFLVYSVARLEQLNQFSLPKPLQFLNDISYTVYLSHVLVLSAIGRLWLMATPAPNNFSIMHSSVFAMLAAVVGYGWWDIDWLNILYCKPHIVYVHAGLTMAAGIRPKPAPNIDAAG